MQLGCQLPPAILCNLPRGSASCPCDHLTPLPDYQCSCPLLYHYCSFSLTALFLYQWMIDVPSYSYLLKTKCYLTYFEKFFLWQGTFQSSC